MKFGTIMKAALEAVQEPTCGHPGPGVCECCSMRIRPALEGLDGLDDAMIAQMNWGAELESQELALIIKALELAEEATDRFGRRDESMTLRRLREGLEALP